MVICPYWSVSLGTWDGDRAMLIRWNGDANHKLGNPASHGWPTWFVLPQEFYTCALAQATTVNAHSAREWLDGGEPTKWEEIDDPIDYDELQEDVRNGSDTAATDEG